MRYVNFLMSVLLPCSYLFVLVQIADNDATMEQIKMTIAGIFALHIISLVLMSFEGWNKSNPYARYYRLSFICFLLYGILLFINHKVHFIYNITGLIIFIFFFFVVYILYFTTSLTDLFDLEKQRKRQSIPRSKWEK